MKTLLPINFYVVESIAPCSIVIGTLCVNQLSKLLISV